MTQATLEHVNLTVEDPEETADRLCRLFGWHVRWKGAALDGFTVHVGTEESYLAVYNPGHHNDDISRKFHLNGGLNHVGVVVEDLKAVEALVVAEGYQPHSHAEYEPGRRFYFTDSDSVEYEVVAYD